MAAIITRVAHRTEAPGADVAQSIAAGQAHAQALTEEGAEDRDLSDDETAAGEVWADHHKGEGSGACPTYSPAFRQGCVDRMNEPLAP